MAPNLTTALATARVGVCPTRLGAGVQNKVLDYFGHRLAVVCSPVGLEGLDARPSEHLLVAESPEAWAAQVLRLLDDELLSQRLADAGRELALSHYRWERMLAPLLDRFDTLLQPPASNVGGATDSAEAAPVMV
jgi:glycosyltransferase involved in cell wall biosynthesis